MGHQSRGLDIEIPTLRFPPGPAVMTPHLKGRTHDCKRLRARPQQFLLASRGPSTHDPWAFSPRTGSVGIHAFLGLGDHGLQDVDARIKSTQSVF
jgi:hypothetical protein